MMSRWWLGLIIQKKLDEYDREKGLKRILLGDSAPISKLRSFSHSLNDEKKESMAEVKEPQEDNRGTNLPLFQLALILINEQPEPGHLSEKIFNELKTELFDERILHMLKFLQEGGAANPDYFGMLRTLKCRLGIIPAGCLAGIHVLKKNGLLKKENIKVIFSHRVEVDELFRVISLFDNTNILTQSMLDRIIHRAWETPRRVIINLRTLYLYQLFTPDNISMVVDSNCDEIGEALNNLYEAKLLTDYNRRMLLLCKNIDISRQDQYLVDAINLLAKYKGLLTQTNLNLLWRSKDNLKFILSTLEHMDLAKIVTQDNFNQVCKNHIYANSIRRVFKELNGANLLRTKRDFTTNGNIEMFDEGVITNAPRGEQVLTQPCFDLIFNSLAAFESETETKQCAGERKEVDSTIFKVCERLNLIAEILPRLDVPQSVIPGITTLMRYSTEQLGNINEATCILVSDYWYHHTTLDAKITKHSLILQNPMSAFSLARTIVILGDTLRIDARIHDALFQQPLNPTPIDLMSCLCEGNIFTRANAHILLDNITVLSVATELREHRTNKTLTQEIFNKIIKRAKMEALCMGLHPRLGATSTLYQFFGATGGKPIDPLSEKQLLKMIGSFL